MASQKIRRRQTLTTSELHLLQQNSAPSRRHQDPLIGKGNNCARGSAEILARLGTM